MATKRKQPGQRPATRTMILAGIAVVLAVVAFVMYPAPWLIRKVRSAGIEASVVVIVVDTLRADRVGCVSGDRNLTPRIDDFAQGATVFSNAYSHAPWTLPSMASLYTSRLPLQHGAGGRLGEFTNLEDEQLTLAEVFERNGSRTAIVANVIFLGPTFGMHQGFNHVDQQLGYDNRGDRDARATTDAALSWLEDRGDDPFMLLVHYFDPHLTYDPPAPFLSEHAPGIDPADVGFGTTRQMIKYRQGKKELTDETVRQLEKLYDGEVAYADSQIGRLLDSMGEMGLLDDIVVVIVSDHGEEFLDHGGFEHGHTLYDELLHVPLIIRFPDQGQGKKIETTVRLMDVAPTLCARAGLSVPDSFVGKSLLPLMQAGAGEHRPVLAQGNMWGASRYAYRKGALKILFDPGSGEHRLFDIASDPRETEDLASSDSQSLSTMSSEVTSLLEAFGVVTGSEVSLTQEQEQMLRSLGYIR